MAPELLLHMWHARARGEWTSTGFVAYRAFKPAEGRGSSFVLCPLTLEPGDSWVQDQRGGPYMVWRKDLRKQTLGQAPSVRTHWGTLHMTQYDIERDTDEQMSHLLLKSGSYI